MTRGRLVEGRRNHFTLHGALHFGHFFGTLIDQQNHHVAVGVVGGNCVRNVLHHDGLAALWRCNQQRPLAFANRRNDVNHPSGDVFFTFGITFQTHLFFGEQRRQVFKHDFVLIAFGRATVYFVELVQCKVAFTVFGCAHFAFNHVARVQIETAHLAGADVDVIGAGRVAGVRAAQKAKAIGQNFQDAVGNDLLSGTGALFNDCKHQLLLAHAAGVFNL